MISHKITKVQANRKHIPLQDNKLTLQVFYSVDDLPESWDKIAPSNNVFLQKPYMDALEKHPPESMQFVYTLLYKEKEPIGIIYCQILHFKADRSIHEENSEPEATGLSKCLFRTIGRSLKTFVASRIEFDAIICGNLLLTGEHGFYYKEGALNPQKSYNVLAEALELLHQQVKQDKGVKTVVTLSKDYFESSLTEVRALKAAGDYMEFSVQPNMVMNIRPEWEQFEDYLAAMSSKYRVRAKRAFKKGKELEKRVFTLEDIKNNRERMNDLYSSVIDNAGFNVATAHPNYFVALKTSLQEKFKVVAYYYKEELIAFFTTIVNDKELEAHFLGFDKSFNRNLQVYLNILYDIVREGIYQQAHQIVFARTAMEIKSSVGAVAYEMYCYMRHRSKLPNKLLPSIFDYLNPENAWTPRQPFKS